MGCEVQCSSITCSLATQEAEAESCLDPGGGEEQWSGAMSQRKGSGEER